VSFLWFVIQKSGDGIDRNAQFELVVATAIGLGLASDGLQRLPGANRSAGMRGFAIPIILCVGLLAMPNLEAYRLWIDPNYRKAFHQHTEIFEAEVRRIAAMPSLVTCNVNTVCRRAGLPFLYDWFFIAQLEATGRFTATHDEERKKIIDFVLIDRRAKAISLYHRTWLRRAWRNLRKADPEA
jgi:hypothetical protein